ncbi:hypothetical protein TNCT_217741 [Trichonephila clavata]|uniref:Uncharacterized protein n=1 Tax=Trichonephila clavata TaxID=2740835 RepID=A0A8X6FNS6_TRICU|nr:hypothetical protein TNCT_217741 [Trichonephila clavata]
MRMKAPRGITNGERGEYHPQFHKSYQQGKGPGEKSTKDSASPGSLTPFRHEQKRQLGNDQFCPDRSIRGGQVRMSCAASFISVAGKNNSGRAESSPTSDATREQFTKESILNREVQVSRINWIIVLAVDQNA